MADPEKPASDESSVTAFLQRRQTGMQQRAESGSYMYIVTEAPRGPALEQLKTADGSVDPGKLRDYTIRAARQDMQQTQQQTEEQTTQATSRFSLSKGA